MCMWHTVEEADQVCLLLGTAAVLCPGGHVHKKLKGKLWDPQQERMVFKTKQAQEYPLALCATIAQQIFAHQFSHFHKTFQLRVPGADRKRALHSAKEWAGHRQAETASKALAAGYQLKRGAAKPLFEIEPEPGEAVQFALQLVHPFSRPAPAGSARRGHPLGGHCPTESAQVYGGCLAILAQQGIGSLAYLHSLDHATM